jgi:hypothetical protein
MTICYWDPISGCYVQTWVPFYVAVMNGWAQQNEGGK